jgi:hypothetical protein
MKIMLNGKQMTPIMQDKYLGFGSELRLVNNKIVQVKYGDTRFNFRRTFFDSTESKKDFDSVGFEKDIIVGPLASITTRDGIVFHFEDTL